MRLFISILLLASISIQAMQQIEPISYAIDLVNSMGQNSHNVYAQAQAFWFTEPANIGLKQYTGFKLIHTVVHEGWDGFCGLESNYLTSESELLSAFNMLLNDLEQDRKINIDISRGTLEFGIANNESYRIELSINNRPPNLQHLRKNNETQKKVVELYQKPCPKTAQEKTMKELDTRPQMQVSPVDNKETEAFIREMFNSAQASDSGSSSETLEQNVAVGNSSCSICFENPKCMLFLPCKHASTCEKCSKALTTCPSCRQNIDDKMKIFL